MKCSAARSWSGVADCFFGFFPMGIGCHLAVILIDECHQCGELVDGLWVTRGVFPDAFALGGGVRECFATHEGAIEVGNVGTLGSSQQRYVTHHRK